MTKTRLWFAAVAVVAAGAGFFLGGATQSSAAPTHTTPATPVCEGVGATSFCHLTIAPDGTEWLFDEDANGTIVFFKQTPSK